LAFKAADPNDIAADFIGKLEKMAPAKMKADGNYAVLQTLAQNGNEKAKKFIEEHGK
jgi:hypothetical protein